jgi:hydrogenase maturation protein HypF
LLAALVQDRVRGRDVREIARAFQRAIAVGLCEAVVMLCEAHTTDTIVLSGGVFQNDLLLEDVRELLAHKRLRLWTNAAVPPNDGGISLGQAALFSCMNYQ